MGKELVSLVAGTKLEGGDSIMLCWKGEPASKVYRYRVVKEEEEEEESIYSYYKRAYY